MILPASIPKSVATIVEDPAPPDSVTTGGVLGGVPGAVLATLVGGALDPTVITTPSPPVPPPPKVKETTGSQVKNPVRIDGQIKYPLIRKRVNPVYPALAKLSRIEGSVVLEAVVDEQGKVSQLKYLSGGHALLIEAAIQAAGQWEFEPCNLNGEPIAIILPITVHFRLGVG
jgi:protein TonB